ncbi:MAG: hypothetical protein JSS93_07530 [Bacteroidetes bacterium]|nr:hypothetical protein [Bacteroidota bacterium]
MNMVRTHKKDSVTFRPDWAIFYQHYFALALINWELNRQEDRLSKPKAIFLKK